MWGELTDTRNKTFGEQAMNCVIMHLSWYPVVSAPCRVNQNGHNEIMVMVTVGAPTHEVSDRLYGVFFEDINLGADGGLNANMVNNYSFEGVYLDHHGLRMQGSRRWRTQVDPLRFWEFDGVSAVSCGTWIRDARGRMTLTECPMPPVHPNSRYVRLSVRRGYSADDARARIENLGYNGGGENARNCAMAIHPGHDYEFSIYVRPVDGMFDMRISVVDRYGLPLTDTAEFSCDVNEQQKVTVPRDGWSEPAENGWFRVGAVIHGLEEKYGKLRIDVVRQADGDIVCDLDCVSLMDGDYWGKNDPKWKFGRLRRDLVEMIGALHPSFIRFPGGCIVEGVTPGNEYQWKDTIGALPARRQQYSMWGFRTPDGSSYSQSYQIGFYEYFCLCEDLGAQPLPTLFAGITCQSPYRDPRHIAIDSPYFRDVVVQNYLDLIDFANGDPAISTWARVRADMGHPEPFGLDMIGIGNENFGADYVAKYDVIARAIHAKDPSILCIMSAGLFPFALPMRRTWEHARSVARVASAIAASADADEHNNQGGTATVEERPETIVAAIGSATGDAIIVDEHSYHSPEWFISQVHRFDKYPRCGAGVYFGEYSANGYFAAQPQRYENACQWRSALAEAAFLTGCERNSDVVRMTSYAPLLAHIPGKGWEQNLIEFNPAYVNPTVNYDVQRLFASNVGAFSYQCEVSPSCPRHLFVSATGDEGARRYIKLVNVGAETVQITLDVSSGLRMLGTQRIALPVLRVETLFGQPGDKRSLSYTGPSQGGIQHETHTYRLSSSQVHVALAIKPYSVTLVIVD